MKIIKKDLNERVDTKRIEDELGEFFYNPEVSLKEIRSFSFALRDVLSTVFNMYDYNDAVDSITNIIRERDSSIHTSYEGSRFD